MLAAAVDPTVLVALIGAPAALITAVGTVWFIAKRGGPAAATASVPTHEQPVNGYRYVTQTELREIVRDLRDEMEAMETRQNSKLDLIVSLLRDRR